MNIFNSINKRWLIVILIGVFLLLIISAVSRSNKPEPPDHGGGEAEMVKILPETNISAPYTIEYVTNVDGVDKVKISDSSPSGRQKAIAWLQAQGYEPSSLIIEYEEFSMPVKRINQ